MFISVPHNVISQTLWEILGQRNNLPFPAFWGGEEGVQTSLGGKSLWIRVNKEYLPTPLPGPVV